MKSHVKVLFIMGPTAVGKSDKTVELAKKFDAEIINCDSVQAYKYLDIGSAKPSVADQRKVAHHLFDFLELDEKITAGKLRSKIVKKIEERKSDCKTFFVVGGNGFYFRALEKGMYPVKEITESIRQQILSEYDTQGVEPLYNELKSKDPEYAKKISSCDSYRVLRAIEIIRTEKKPISEIQKQPLKNAFPYKFQKIILNRPKEEIRSRVAKRTRKMIERGIVQETQKIINNGFVNVAPLKSVGYLETVEYLNGKIKTLDLLEEKMNQSTMKLVKKQLTWFKKEEVHKFDLSYSPKALDDWAQEYLLA